MNSRPLLIFLHLPKCAGLTFRYHAKKNLNEEERMLLSYKCLGLDPNNPSTDYKVFERATKKYLSRFSDEQKDKIKLIYGHTVIWGVHKYFKRPYRYFTFIRNPVDRVVSLYNYLVYLFENVSDEESYKYYKKTLLVNEKIPNFETWLKLKYDNKLLRGYLTQSGALKIFGYLKGRINDITISKALKKFYFVGIAGNYSKDSLFIYNQLGFNKFFIDQNITPKTYSIGKDEKIEKEIIKYNFNDLNLFQQSFKKNKKFECSYKNFDKLIKNESIKRKYLLPFTQFLFAPRHTIIRAKEFVFNNAPFIRNKSIFTEKLK